MATRRTIMATPRQIAARRLMNGPGYLNSNFLALATAKAPYVLAFDQFGAKIVPRSMSGLGFDPTIGIPAIGPFPAGTMTPDAPESPAPVVTMKPVTATPSLAPGNSNIAIAPAPPAAPPQPQSWTDQLFTLLNGPVVPGSQIKNWHILAGLTFVGAVAMAKGGGRRR